MFEELLHPWTITEAAAADRVVCIDIDDCPVLLLNALGGRRRQHRSDTRSHLANFVSLKTNLVLLYVVHLHWLKCSVADMQCDFNYASPTRD